MVNFAALSGTDYGRSHFVDFCQWTSLDSAHGGPTLDLGSTLGFSSLIESGHLAQLLASQVSFAPLHPACCGLSGRIGEADNPGPTIQIGTTNTAGIRRKESHLLGLGPGIWCASETHLTSVTQRSTDATFRHLAQDLNRTPKVLYGAPVAPRANSEWAGTWSGVLTLSDVPARPLSLPWPSEVWSTGRVQASRHFVNQIPFTIVNIYGYAVGPTWPRAHSLTETLLCTVTEEIVLGCSGPRLICGDLNCTSSSLEAFEVWKNHGWQSLQDFAASRWGWAVVPTCKKVTERDFIWCSPEALDLLCDISIQEAFCDHSVLIGHFKVLDFQLSLRSWLIPARIPWDSVDRSGQDQLHMDFVSDGLTATERVTAIGLALEEGLDGRVQGQPDGCLTSQQKGRGKRTNPKSIDLVAPTSRPSRQGEVALRGDLAGRAVHLWFKQLRRLQSYWFASRANCLSPSAVAYRLELWAAIRRARGFSSSFPVWWTSNSSGSQFGVPLTLPEGPPGALVAEAVFRHFKCSFEKFENWHLRQRSTSLKMKHEQSMEALHKELRDSKGAALQLLEYRHEYTVDLVDTGSGVVYLDREVVCGGASTWSLDGVVVVPTSVHGLSLGFSFDLSGLIGSTLVQHQTLSSVTDVQQAMLDFWTPKWQAIENISDELWSRLSGFVTAFMPKLSLHLPPITMDQWRKGLRRFKSHAARGTDGFSHLDLINMPEPLMASLLDLFNGIEEDRFDWPLQFLHGLVNSLPKTAVPSGPADFRPVVILPVAYRAWSSIRSKQMIRFLLPYVSEGAHGFLPGKEPMQIWASLQGHIECAAQGSLGLSGLSTDLRKAFNCIARPPTFALTSHLGAPLRLIHAWSTYLGGFDRTFRISTFVGAAATSTVGYPEGCGLSVYAMLNVCWAWHKYMECFHPSIQATSYVDNLGLRAFQPELVAAGFFGIITFFQFFHLEVDPAKTFTWGLKSQDRKTLAGLGFVSVSAASELGGSMTYGTMIRNSQLKARGSSLVFRWSRLKHSPAPMFRKLAVLPCTFWPTALHGALGCRFGPHYLHTLRQSAIKALRLGGAGVNALLRLSLCVTPTADPGFWHLKDVFHGFQRMLRKTPDFLLGWYRFMENFSGQLFPGPFSKLLELTELLGWTITDPPFLTDHDGFSFNLQEIGCDCLNGLLYDGWLQHVARQVRSRDSMKDLEGLDGFLTRWQLSKLSGQEVSMVSALNSGAFMDNFHHAKFDLTKQRCCAVCGVADTVDHWFVCPRFHEAQTALDGFEDWVSWPVCFRHHLLVPRPSYTALMKSYFHNLQDATRVFFCKPQVEAPHIFTDGSCFADSGNTLFHLAAWSAVDASSGRVIATAPLHGLPQTIGRAEMVAIIAGLEWCCCNKVVAHFWCDSLFVAKGLATLILVGDIPAHWENYDLWKRILLLLEVVPLGTCHVHWIPSHLDPLLCETPFESWIAQWNDVADRIAVQTNQQRTSQFWQLLAEAQDFDDVWSRRVQALRTFYFKVAELKKSAVTPPLISISDEDQHLDGEPLNSFFFHGWQCFCTDTANSKLPLSFGVNILEWLFTLEEVHEGVLTPISFLELTFLISSEALIPFPFRESRRGIWVFQYPCQRLERPTLSYLYRMVRSVLLACLSNLDLLDLVVCHLDKTEVGINFPTDGMNLRLAPGLYNGLRESIRSFTSRRPLRKACDLARPI